MHFGLWRYSSFVWKLLCFVHSFIHLLQIMKTEISVCSCFTFLGQNYGQSSRTRSELVCACNCFFMQVYRLCRVSSSMIHKDWQRKKERKAYMYNIYTDSCAIAKIPGTRPLKFAFYWAIQAGLLTPLTFARHRLSPLAACTSGAYFPRNGRRWQWICEFYTANVKGIFWGT